MTNLEDLPIEQPRKLSKLKQVRLLYSRGQGTFVDYFIDPRAFPDIDTAIEAISPSPGLILFQCSGSFDFPCYSASEGYEEWRRLFNLQPKMEEVDFMYIYHAARWIRWDKYEELTGLSLPNMQPMFRKVLFQTSD